MWDGRSLCCQVARDGTAFEKLDRLNQRIMQEYPVFRSNYYMEMQGKPLSIHNGDYFLWKDNADIFVQYRNPGGCFMVSLTVLTMIMMAIIGSTCTCGLSLLIVPLLLPLLFILPFFCLWGGNFLGEEHFSSAQTYRILKKSTCQESYRILDVGYLIAIAPSENSNQRGLHDYRSHQKSSIDGVCQASGFIRHCSTYTGNAAPQDDSSKNMTKVQTIVQLLQEQNDSMERFANAQALLLNVSSARTSPSTAFSDELDDALSSLYEIRNRLRCNLKQLEQEELFCKFYPRHLALSKRVAQTIAANPSWHPNGLPSHTRGITETNTVALASLRASIERINEAERERSTAWIKPHH